MHIRPIVHSGRPPRGYHHADGCLAVVPNFLSKETLARLPAIAQNRIGLGLDLRGGAHLLTTMDLDELKKDWLTNIVDDVRKRLRDAKIPAAVAIVSNR